MERTAGRLQDCGPLGPLPIPMQSFITVDLEETGIGRERTGGFSRSGAGADVQIQGLRCQPANLRLPRISKSDDAAPKRFRDSSTPVADMRQRRPGRRCQVVGSSLALAFAWPCNSRLASGRQAVSWSDPKLLCFSVRTRYPRRQRPRRRYRYSADTVPMPRRTGWARKDRVSALADVALALAPRTSSPATFRPPLLRPPSARLDGRWRPRFLVPARNRPARTARPDTPLRNYQRKRPYRTYARPPARSCV